MQKLPISKSYRQSNRAYTLIEMMVSIAVIALIAGIAVPMISSIFQRSEETAARRNAQTIAGIASTASAAGNTEISSAADKDAAVNLLVAGVHGQGQFAESVFIVNLENEDRVKALKFLEFKDGTLAFDPEAE